MIKVNCIYNIDGIRCRHESIPRSFWMGPRRCLEYPSTTGSTCLLKEQLPKGLPPLTPRKPINMKETEDKLKKMTSLTKEREDILKEIRINNESSSKWDADLKSRYGGTSIELGSDSYSYNNIYLTNSFYKSEIKAMLAKYAIKLKTDLDEIDMKIEEMLI